MSDENRAAGEVPAAGAAALSSEVPAAGAAAPASEVPAAGEAAPASEVPAIELEDVSFSYDGQTDALSHVSVVIARGSWTCLLGRNASGKSTLVSCLNGLIVPDEGHVRVFGTDTADPSPAACTQVRRRVGLVFQNPDDQLVTSIVADDVAFGPENLGVPREQIVARVNEALAQVGMAEHADADAAELSAGQRQRVAIAGVLAMGPDVLVLDEAGSMLDPAARAGLRDLVRKLNGGRGGQDGPREGGPGEGGPDEGEGGPCQSGRGITVVEVTHTADDALDADRVLVADGGRIVFDGTPDQLFSPANAELLQSCGLEAPFAVRLWARLGQLGAAPEGGMPAPLTIGSLEDALAAALGEGAS